MLIDVVDEFAEEIADGRVDGRSDVCLPNDDIARNGAKGILVVVRHRETAQGNVVAVCVLGHHILGSFARGVLKMQHAVEVDTIQIGLHLQSDVLAQDVLVSLLAEDGKRGEEKRMEEGGFAEVPYH